MPMQINRPRPTTSAALLLALLQITTPSLAGPLAPPPGPIASTHKTLSEVEPRKALSAANTPGDANSVFQISQPGSYYLTADIFGASGKHGIEITTTGDVSIDLGGFRMVGGAGSLRAITTASSFSNARISVRNGAVAHWLSGGIIIDANDRPAQVQDITAHDNGGHGIAAGPGSTITRCVARANAAMGISVKASSSISECTADANGAGFVLGSTSTAANCSATSNSLAGFSSTGTGLSFTACSARLNSGAGFQAGASIFIACSAIDNNANGIDAGTDSSLSNCQARDNTLAGIVAGEGSNLAHCSSRANGTGFILGAATTVDHCIAIRNTGHGFLSNAVGCAFTACTARLNGGSGYFGNGGTYTSCAARENSATGFDAGNASVITGCTALGNTADGIRIIGDCLVLNNLSASNGAGAGADAAGIHATSENNRIEGNSCRGNDRGIQVDDAANLIFRNNVAGANAYLMTGVQSIGPIITSFGNVTSTNPWANFDF